MFGQSWQLGLLYFAAVLQNDRRGDHEHMPGIESVVYSHRAELVHGELQALFTAAWGSPKADYRPVLAHSFTWVSAHTAGQLVGFVNVAWDGGVHFFLLDTTVHPDWRHQGIGRRLVHEAISDCRGRGEWMHVDSDADLMSSFYGPCGFDHAPAGVMYVGT